MDRNKIVYHAEFFFFGWSLNSNNIKYDTVGKPYD